MGSLRLTVVTLLALVLVPLTATAAEAAPGERCVSTSQAKRCAWFKKTGVSAFYGAGYAIQRGDRIKVRVTGVALQRKTSNGWRNVSYSPGTGDFENSDLEQTDALFCREVRAGRYRVKTWAEWKVDGTAATSRGTMTSRPVGKGRLCS